MTSVQGWLEERSAAYEPHADPVSATISLECIQLALGAKVLRPGSRPSGLCESASARANARVLAMHPS